MKLVEDFGYQAVELLESSSQIPGVLGTMKGNFFFANVPSRNKRIYPRETWESGLREESVKRFLNERLMFGTIGHDDVDFDTLVRERKISHVTTKLKLQADGTGYGEADILDTPVGRVLYTILRSGSKIAVSSKAVGESNGKDDDGNDIVDSKSFRLQRFDAVIDPGFLGARPEIKEQLNEAFSIQGKNLTEQLRSLKPYKEEGKMELAEKVMNEKIELEHKLAEVTETLANRNERITILETVNKEVEELRSKNKLFTEQNGEQVKELDTYRKFFAEVGKPEDIMKTLTASEDFSKKVAEIGTLEDIKKALTQVKENTSALGSFEDIKKALTAAKVMGEGVKKLGGIKMVTEALNKAHKYVTKTVEKNLRKEAATLAAKYGSKDKDVVEMIKSLGKDKTVSILENIGKPAPTKKVVKEDVGKMSGGRVVRLMEHMGALKTKA